jgi:DNA repair protein RadA/Sms
MNIHNPDVKCKECGRKLKTGILFCKHCHIWNLGGSGFDFDEHTVLLSDAKISNVERVKTGGLVDHIFGGGIANTSVNLLAGEPGAGKTTLCLQLADWFATLYQKEALYIANEQADSELKDTGERLNLKSPGLIRVVKGMGGISFDLGELLMKYKPCLILLDSVTKWSGEDLEMQVVICQRLKDYSVSLKAPSVVVNQVTKGGDHAGLNKMQHAVDMCCLFEVLHEDEEEISANQTIRRLWSTKNRFGPAPEEQFYQMTATGLVGISKEEAEAEEEPKSSTLE